MKNKKRVARQTFRGVVCGIVLACAVGCRKPEVEAPEPVVKVQVAQPTRGRISEQIAADAILAPLQQAAISPRISAPLRAEYVQRGAHVRRGQLLATLEDRDLRGSAMDSQGAVVSAEANYMATLQATVPEAVTKAQTDVKQLGTAFEVAHRTTVERENLFKQGAISGRDVDAAVAAEAQAKAAYETAQVHAADVARTTRKTDAQNARGLLTSAKGRLASADAQVSYAELRSPIDGVVTERPLFPGETATSGTPVITVMDTSSLLAKLHLAQASTQKLSIGDAAEVHIPGVDGSISAQVSFIGPALDPGSTTVEVWLKLPNPDGRLKVGTPAHAVLSGKTVPDALQVPAKAIVPGQDGGTAVMIVGDDGAAHRKPVILGIRTTDSVQIISGITPRDRVITEGGYGLDNGTKVVAGRPGADDDDAAAGDDKDSQ